jgi:radical SAM superfamily enzyme YgiQ (UPF0313 family)
MNILLVQAYLGETETPVFPLGLSCLTAAIKGHNLKVFDPNILPSQHQELANLLRKFRPDVMGISLRNIDSTNKRKVVFYYKYFKEMINVVNDISGNRIKIIVGGPGFSMFAIKIMYDEPRIDYGVFGEGEITFPQLIENLETPQKVKGIFYRKGKKILFTGPRKNPDLDNLQFAYQSLFNLEYYMNIPDAIGVETKRGCALGCIYCIYGFLNGKQYRLRKPVSVGDEIEFLVKKKGIKHFTFIDSVFNLPLDHAKSICSEIINRKLNVSWSAWFHDKYLTKEFVQLFKKAGCNKFILSPDGFSDRTLKRLGKSQNKEDVLRAFNILNQFTGIEICYNFFKNPPGQNLRNFILIVLFCIKAKLRFKNKIHFEFNSLRIEPHTKLCDIAIDEGIIEKGENLLFPKYYINRKTWYIEKFFDALHILKNH